MKPMSIDAELEELLSMGGGSEDARSSPQSSLRSKLSPLGSPTIERGTTHRTPLNSRIITQTSTYVCLVMVLATIHLMTTYFTYPYEEMLAMDFIILCSPHSDNRLRTLVIFIARLAIATISYLVYSIVLCLGTRGIQRQIERWNDSEPLGYSRRYWDLDYSDDGMDAKIQLLSSLLGRGARILHVPVRPVVLATVRLVFAEGLKVWGARLGAKGEQVALIGTVGIICSFLYW